MAKLKEMESRDGVNRFISSCESRNLSPQTIQNYLWALKPFAEAIFMLPTQPEPIEEYLGSLQGAPETRYARFNALRIFYKFLNERYKFPNPMKKIRAPRKQRSVVPSLTDEDIVNVLKATTSLRDYAMIRLFLDNGIRRGEAATLQQENVGEKIIKVKGKEGDEEVPISPDVRDLLRQLGPAPGPVFKAYGIQQFSVSGMGQLINRILVKANVSTKKKGPHILRHTFARVFLMNGGDAISLKNILRHSTLGMTERYVHLWGSDIYSKHQQFSPSRGITVKPPEERRGRGRPRKVSLES